MAEVIASRYQVIEKIGAGGMGTVFRGLDTNSNQPVAIKQLKPEVSTPELIERFIREGAALRDLNHPNIIKMLDEVEENGNHYLIMEYLPAGDLADLLKQGEMPVEKVLQLAIDICDALTRAHRLDIIHRDLKPANVLIAGDGTPRLTDFGIAHIGKQERVTDTDAIVGTVDYLAPELLDGEDIDTRADIWSFGVMLFEILAGKRPFSGDSVTQTLMAIMTHPVPDLEALRPDAPVALVDLVYRMLEKSRDARVRSVRHVGAELEDILHGRSTHTPPETRFAADTPDILNRPKHNLPAQTTPFVGREAELREVAKLLDDPKLRLITIVASGGMGKTRLALESAEQYITPPQPEASGRGFTDGVYFVELAPLSDPANIVSAIADATGYQFQSDGRDQKQQILDFLGNKNLLLVLDNFEHLLEGAPLVTEILKACPNVQILATSRQRLNQSSETIFNLAGMDFPDWETPDDALEYAAVKLFMQSAKRVQPDLEVTADNMDFIARICNLVQGMPLGILLAASWLEMLSVEEIADEIAKGIDFLESDMSDLPERHRSIRAVFDYSWNLMTDDEKQVFMKLSVFRGGFTREAVQEVTGANLRILMGLMNKSLIRRDTNTGRYQIHELLRQYGEEKLEKIEETVLTLQHYADYFLRFIVQSESEASDSQLIWLNRLETEYENVQKSLGWLVQNNLGDAIQMIENLRIFWMYRGLAMEGLQWVQRIFRYETDLSDLHREKLLFAGAFLAKLLGEHRQSIDWLRSAIELSRSHNNKLNLASALRHLATSLSAVGEFSEAKVLAEESLKLYRHLNNRRGIAGALLYLGEIYRTMEDYKQAEAYYRESLELWTEIGVIGVEMIVLGNLGTVVCFQGRYDQAQPLLTKALNLAMKLNDRGMLQATILGFAYLYYGINREHDVVQLLGLAFKEQQQGNPLQHTELQEAEKVMNQLRNALGDSSFESE